MAFEFGDVVVVLFPFTDVEVKKPRPALVISNQHFNSRNDHCILAMITTATRSAWPDDVLITDGNSAGLTHSSIIRWKVFTLPNTVIARQIGTLSIADRERASSQLRSAVG